MSKRCWLIVISLFFLVSCMQAPVKKEVAFRISENSPLYSQSEWALSGRMALSDENTALSASIYWRHEVNLEEIELAGPFGQGRTKISLLPDHVVVDYGDGERREHYGDVEAFVSAQLGVDVPVLALKYWLLGLVDPALRFEVRDNGFYQSGWVVIYRQMQWAKEHYLPRKVNFARGQTKLKLLVNDWDI